ncbi:MAG: sugar ABC transporter permease [Bacillota bacterium]|nr:sugar ABC transporter permease [Bacillota bacterium]HHU61609.1 sugar ABC transporter permease [Natronincola sp.]
MSAVVTPEKQVAEGSAQIRPGRLKTLWQNMKANKISYLFVGPFMVLFAIFVVVPIAVSVGLSFTYFNMIEPPRWVGWSNYLTLFLEDDVFLIAVKNTLFFAAITGPISYLLCFVFAWLINELKPKIRTILTLLFYAPSISANAFMIWTVMFSGDAYGYINGVLLYWGIVDKPIQWLLDPTWMMPIVIVVVLWMSLGVSFLTFIAGLQGIDPSFYEAGVIDGIRNRWQELWYLTLPMMKNHMMFGAIISITNSFAAAEQLQALTGNTPTDWATWTVMQHINDYGYVRYEMGYASAMAVLLFLTMVLVQRLVQRLLRKIG